MATPRRVSLTYGLPIKCFLAKLRYIVASTIYSCLQLLRTIILDEWEHATAFAMQSEPMWFGIGQRTPNTEANDMSWQRTTHAWHRSNRQDWAAVNARLTQREPTWVGRGQCTMHAGTLNISYQLFLYATSAMHKFTLFTHVTVTRSQPSSGYETLTDSHETR